MTAPYYADGPVTLYVGDCIDVMRELPDASVDAVVTDPPYGLEFMGKEWDRFGRAGGTAQIDVTEGTDRTHPFRDGASRIRYGREGVASMHAFQAWCEKWATEALRVLKPGGHLLAFGGTRTFHRLTAGIEDAGFEIRDSIAWLYGSGFPKSLDVFKAIDKAAGAQRQVLGPGRYAGRGRRTDNAVYAEATPSDQEVHTLPATEAAEQWQGWGTALKPAFEPIVVARKSLIGTVAANVLAHGTGALNIDASRIRISDADRKRIESMGGFGRGGYTRPRTEATFMQGTPTATAASAHAAGRWPSNVILDESQAAALDAQSGERRSAGDYPSDAETVGMFGDRKQGQLYADNGGASRFFYTAKAGPNERPSVDGTSHPTVKPVDLMRWLVRLVTPKGGTVLEPFAGSGTTVEACVLEGFDCIAIEREPTYLPLIEKRIRKPHHVGFDFGDWDGAA